MQAVILAAGRGTRMGPLTETMPKPMLPVADRPLVAHVADAAVEAGADELVFTVGYGGDRIRDHFGSEYAGVPVQYAEQPEQLGTADALAAAARFLTDDFAVLNGDSLYDTADLTSLFESVPQVGAFYVENPSEYGVLVTEDGIVTEVREKPEHPPSNLINAGAYTFPEDSIKLLDVPESERGERELTDVLDRIIERDELEAVTFENWMDIGRPWELLAANERRLPGTSARWATDGGDVTLVERGGVTVADRDELTDADRDKLTDADRDELTDQEGDASNERGDANAGVGTRHARGIHPDATIRGDVVIEANVTIGPGVVIDGPVLVRSGSSIGPNAYVRGASLIGPNVHIGHAVEIKNSVVMAETNVGHLSYVGDSILARGVNLGAGTNVANLRHDNDSVIVTVNGDRVSTGRRKFGAVLGPQVKTAIQTGINAGVTLSANARTQPGEMVLRDR